MGATERQSSSGLNYEELNFTKAQYEEALRRIDSPENTNQLLVALIEVSQQDLAAASTTVPSSSLFSSPVSSVSNSNKWFSSNDDNVFNQQVQTPTTTWDRCQLDSINHNYHQQPQTLKSQCLLPTLATGGESTSSSTSLSTSCYPSITSFPSSASSDQSLESLNHQPQAIARPVASALPTLRKIYIDGSNVARTHGRNGAFSWLGIKLCVDWFLSRHHKSVKVLVPMDKCNKNNNTQQQQQQQQRLFTDEDVINHLEDVDALITTPPECNDDLFIIRAAHLNNGIIVSNDLYRDETRFDDELKKYIKLNRLPYIFADDIFIPANDPLGRSGPTLSEFLREPIATANGGDDNHQLQHKKLSRAKSHQKYHHNQKFAPGSHSRQQFAGGYSNGGHRSLHSTKSLPVESPPLDYQQQPSSYYLPLPTTLNGIPTANKCPNYNHYYQQQHNHPAQQSSGRNQIMHNHPSSIQMYDNYSNANRTATTTTWERQPIRKSISCLAANNHSGPNTKNVEQQQQQLQHQQSALTNNRKTTALCRTKSHNI